MPSRRSRRARIAVAWPIVLALLVAGIAGGSAPSEQRREAAEPETPVARRTVEPCCPPAGRGTPVEASRPASTPPVEIAVPEGEVLPEERIGALKEAVRRNPGRLIRGEELVEASPQPQDSSAAGTVSTRPAPSQVRVRNKFTALDRATSEGLGFVFFPSDANVASGPDHWVQGTNSAFALLERGGTGGQRPERRLITSMNDHWGQDEEPFHFDPRVLYDAESGRFFLVAVTVSESPRRSFVWVSVSRSARPPDLGAEHWCNYRFRGKRGASWADFPSTGVNRDWFVVTANNFRFANDSFKRPFLYALDKRGLVDNADGCPSLDLFVFRPGRDPDGSRPFTVQPARHLDVADAPPGTAPLYLVHTPCCGRTEQYGLWRLQGDGDGRPTLSRATVTGTGYAIPPNAPQKGGGPMLDTDIQRVQAAVARDGSVYFTHTTACLQGQTPVSCIRVGRITPRTPLETSQVTDWTFGHGPRRYLWMPGIAVNARGEVLSVFQIAGERLFLGVGIAAMGPGDDGFGTLRTLRRGNQNQECVGGGTRNRTGDYVGVAVDPNDDASFVATGQFNDERVGFQSTCNWNTIIGVLDF